MRSTAHSPRRARLRVALAAVVLTGAMAGCQGSWALGGRSSSSYGCYDDTGTWGSYSYDGLSTCDGGEAALVFYGIVLGAAVVVEIAKGIAECW